MDSILTTDLISVGRVKINDNFAAVTEFIQEYIDNLDWQPSVLSKSINVAPEAVDGARYIVGTVVSSSDPWFGHDDSVAIKTSTGWTFMSPNKGYCTLVEDENLEYVWTVAEGWISRAYATWHNHLGGLDGGGTNEYYHLTQDTHLGLANVTELDPAVVDSDSRLSDTRDPNAHTHSESDITDLQSYSLLNHTHAYSADDHDVSHVTGGSDEIDGDKLDIDFTPAYYTPDSNPEYSDNLDHLASHLNGIDYKLGVMLGDIADIETGGIDSIDMTIIDCGPVGEAPAGIWLQFNQIDGGSF